MLEGTNRAALTEQITIDERRYKELHGMAILSRFSRFRLVNVRLIPFPDKKGV